MIRYAVLPTIAVAMTLGLAPAAHADTHYGGTGLYKQTRRGTRRWPDPTRQRHGSTARLNLAYYRCGG